MKLQENSLKTLVIKYKILITSSTKGVWTAKGVRTTRGVIARLVEIYSGMHVRIISKVFIVKLVLVTLNVSRCRACEGWKNTRRGLNYVGLFLILNAKD
jgi:hypothetical protein